MTFSAVIVAYENCWSMNLATLKDFTRIAGILERKRYGENTITCHIASVNGNPVQTASGSQFPAEQRIERLPDADLILLPAIEGSTLDAPLRQERDLLQWLNVQKIKGTPIAALSTGVEILGRAGLLNNGVIATHWAFMPMFRRRYPGCRFVSHSTFIESDGIFTTGSLTGGVDILLYFLGRYRDDKFSKLCAAHGLLTAPDQATPLLPGRRNHRDEKIIEIQSWIEECYPDNLTIDESAQKFNLSPTSLKRRFKRATGLSFTQYLQAVRVEKAKHLLLASNDSIQTISHHVGYENQSFFIRLFKTLTGVTPGKYRSSPD